MGFDRKYGKVTTEHGDIPDDEPVVVFRARDINTPKLLGSYLALCIENDSPKYHLDMIQGTYQLFKDWQEKNPDKVKIPDSERSKEWMTNDNSKAE